MHTASDILVAFISTNKDFNILLGLRALMVTVIQIPPDSLLKATKLQTWSQIEAEIYEQFFHS